jgi:dynein light intermediate chain 1
MAEVTRYTTNTMQTSTMDEPSTRSKSSEESKKGIWSSMLDNVASGKRLPEKSILVLGLYLLNRLYEEVESIQ